MLGHGAGAPSADVKRRIGKNVVATSATRFLSSIAARCGALEAPSMRMVQHASGLTQLAADKPQPIIEAFDKTILHGFARSDELQRDAPAVDPRVECSTLKLRAIVDDDPFGELTRSRQLFEHGGHTRVA